MILIVLIAVIIIIVVWMFYKKDSGQPKKDEKEILIEKIKNGERDGIDDIEYLRLRQYHNFGKLTKNIV